MLSNLPSPNIYTSPDDGLPTMSKERLEAPIIPATPDNMCCLDGCVYYWDSLEDSEDLYGGGIEGFEGKELRRYCSKFGTKEGPSDLSEDAIYACSAFRPRWWSIRAWKRWARCKRELKAARAEIAKRSQLAADREAGKLTLVQETEEL